MAFVIRFFGKIDVELNRNGCSEKKGGRYRVGPGRTNFTVANANKRVYTHNMKQCYCVALRKASRKVSTVYDRALMPAGVSVAQFSLLTAIQPRPSVSFTELGRAAELDRSTIGRNVRVLERMGLVEILRGEDLREATIVLTPAGSGALKKAAPLWDRAQKRVEAALGDDGATALQRLLVTL